MFLLRSLAASFLACAEPTLVYIRFIWSSGFFTVIKFSADTSFLRSFRNHCRLRSPSQRLCKHFAGIEFHFASAWQVRQCFILFSQRFWNCSSASSPPEGADFLFFLCLLPFLKKHRKQRLGSGDKNCVVSHQWTQVHLPIYLQNNITNNSGSQKNVTHTIHVISAPTKNLIWLKTILNLLCVFRHLLLRAKLPEPDRDQAERVWFIGVSKLPTSGNDQKQRANEADEQCIFQALKFLGRASDPRRQEGLKVYCDPPFLTSALEQNHYRPHF